MRQLLLALWSYRYFILGSVKREFQSKYVNSLLGAVWTVIHPLALIVVFTVIFSQVMSAKLPGVEDTLAFSIYLCAGMITWALFSEITTRGQTVFIDNANLMKKLFFPRIALPAIIVAGALINFTIVFCIFTLFLIASGRFPGLVFLAMAPLILIQVIFSVGIGVSLGVLNVFFRDVGHFFGVALQFWFWFTPIIYPIGILPTWAMALVEWNPMTALITSYQKILAFGQLPDWSSLWLITLLGVLLCNLGFRLFRNRVGEMVDEL